MSCSTAWSIRFCRSNWIAFSAAGTVGGAVGLGTFDPEPDMVRGVRRGDGGFSGEIDDSSSDESELIGRGGDRGCWDDTLAY